MTHRLAIALVTTLSMFAVASPTVPLAAAEAHVRPGDDRLGKNPLQTGISRSATFRGLVETLDASDLIVDLSLQLGRPGLRGYLVHDIGITGENRYVRVILSVRMTDTELVAVLAHELQHAVEVARATHVRQGAQVRVLFEQIGISTRRSRVLETERPCWSRNG